MTDFSFLQPVSVGNKMRIGPNCDGGYVVYKPALERTDVLISYGVGWDIRLETEYQQKSGNKVYLFDPSMFTSKSIWINDRRIHHLLKLYLRQFQWRIKINRLRKRGIFFSDEGLGRIKIPKFDSFPNHLKRFNISSNNILLKIDIEGGEYDIFRDNDFCNSLRQVEMLVIEFHDLKNKLRLLYEIIGRLSEFFVSVHIHANNCAPLFTMYRKEGDIQFPDAIEMTFVRKTSLLKEDILPTPTVYPCPNLDFRCSALFPDVPTLTFS